MEIPLLVNIETKSGEKLSFDAIIETELNVIRIDKTSNNIKIASATINPNVKRK